MKNELSDVEKDILRIVHKDGDMGYKQIGGIVYRSQSSVSKYIRILKENKVILRTTTQLDPSSVGIYAVGHLYIKTCISMDELKAKLLPILQVCSCTSISGTTNVRVKVATQDSKSFDRVKESIARIPRVCVMRVEMELDEVIPDRGFTF